jgi:SAM-dependent methyltransferase
MLLEDQPMETGLENSAHWDSRYLKCDTPWDSGLVSRELDSMLREAAIPPGRAFELGCGTGINAVHLATLGFDVVAADCSQVAINRARQRAAAAGVKITFVVADLCRVAELRSALAAAGIHWPDRSVTFLFDRGCYHCARKSCWEGYRDTVRWLAAPGARLLMLCGNANEPGTQGPPRVTESEIRQDWSELCEIDRLREFRFEDRGGVPGPLGWSCWMTVR